MATTTNIIVLSHRILGTRTTVFEAWEPGDVMDTHSTVTSIDGRWFGHVPSRALPTEIEQMPIATPERIAAVQEFQARNKAEAVEAILAAHPEIDETDPKVRIVGGRVEVDS